MWQNYRVGPEECLRYKEDTIVDVDAIRLGCAGEQGWASVFLWVYHAFAGTVKVKSEYSRVKVDSEGFWLMDKGSVRVQVRFEMEAGRQVRGPRLFESVDYKF